MTALVSEQKYRNLTGDLRSPVLAVETALVVAQSLIELRLGRGLGFGVHTETLPMYSNGIVHPRNTPLEPSQYGYVDSATLQPSVYSFPPGQSGSLLLGTMVRPRVIVSYSGGYTAETLPQPLALGIASLAKWTFSPEGQMQMQGLKSFTEGDISATFGEDGSESSWPVGIWNMVSRWRAREVATA